jgi:hypothetical protein
MQLSYIDVFGDRQRHTIEATISTNDANSSYGQPVIRLEGGYPLDHTSWSLMGYRVVSLDPGPETDLMEQWMDSLDFLE